jgi:hypothetical protein
MTDADFIEFINETNPEVTICGLTFSPGNILKEMDPVTFRCMKNDYISMLEDENENLSIQIDDISHINEN